MITSGIHRVAVQSLFIFGLACLLLGCNEASKATSSQMMQHYEARQYRLARLAAREVADGTIGRP